VPETFTDGIVLAAKVGIGLGVSVALIIIASLYVWGLVIHFSGFKIEEHDDNYYADQYDKWKHERGKRGGR
jgi:hypothetical protein